jgi:serine/threonine-protein kinase
VSLPEKERFDRDARREGLVLGGKYRLGALLGEGAAGAVYAAENLSIHRRVAVKLLDASLVRTPEIVERFRREAQAAGSLAHPHVVEVLDLGATDDGLPFIVMEHLEGSTLGELLDREGALEDIALQALGALAAAHGRGIVHRDLKPDNIFLTRRGKRGDFVKLFDFGVAKFLDPGEGGVTAQGTTVGTPDYMSPEQVRGKDVDPRSDVYSMAVVLWEMLAGRPPHDGASSNEIMTSIVTKAPPALADFRPDVDPRLSSILARAMRRAPGERTASATELAAALEPFGAALEIDVSEQLVSLPPRAAPPAEPRAAGEAPTASDAADTSPMGLTVPAGQRSIATERLWAPRGARARGLLAGGLVVLCAVTAAALWVSGSGSRKPARSVITATPIVSSAPSLPGSPPQTPAVDRRVPIEVDANVSVAFVTLDGDPLGTTPLRVEVAATPGEHVVEVSADDHAPTRRTVWLDAPVRLTIDLAPLSPSRPRGTLRPAAKQPRPRTFDPFRPQSH